MQTQDKSFKKQLIFSLSIFALLSIIVAISILALTDRIYRNIIFTEIESTTEIISQSIDKFLKVPDDYLLGLKNHIDEVHLTPEVKENNCIINDIINFTKTFESVYLLDTNGRILSTWPESENYLDIDMSNQHYFKKTFEPDTIYWSDTFISNTSGHPTVALTTKCEKGIIVAYYNLDQLGDFISVRLPDEEDSIFVIDAKGNIIANTHHDHLILNSNINNMNSIKSARTGVFGIFDDYYKGVRGLASLKPARVSGFIILVFKSYHRIFKNLYRIYIVFLIIIASISAIFLIMIIFIVRNFLKPMDNLQITFRTVASGTYNLLPNSQFTELKELTKSFVSMVEKIKEREADLRRAIEDRETLLYELNHRTKNNMQLIIGMMAMYSLKNPESDPKGILNKIQSKIETISLVHDNLFRSPDLSRIDFKKYIEELIPSLINSLSDPLKKIECILEIENIQLLIDYAVPCGLILNEFIINTIKYAFNERTQGKIMINCETIGSERLEITYSDDGIGLPDSFNHAETKSLGFSIINNIVISQLRGDIDIRKGGGFYCKFGFNLNTYVKRI